MPDFHQIVTAATAKSDQSHEPANGHVPHLSVEELTPVPDTDDKTPVLKHVDSPASVFRPYRPNTPSTRTGPPRTLSYTYSLPNSPIGSRANSRHENEPLSELLDAQAEDYEPRTDATEYAFRSPWEYDKGKKRESKVAEEGWDGWNPLKWFHESPKEEKADFDWGTASKPASRKATEDDQPQSPTEVQPGTPAPAAAAPSSSRQTTRSFGLRTLTRQNTRNNTTETQDTQLRRTASDPHKSSENKEQRLSRVGMAKWSRLRSLLPRVTDQHNNPISGPSAVTHHSVNITDELITGGLSTLMLRLWFERDEKGHRRIPVLLHRLRIRISDSLHPLQGSSSVFRIECEYANGAARWVIYRQLRDFISLHYHYAISNARNRNVDDLPEFPKTSLPYLKFLNRDKPHGDSVTHADFARMQRNALETYLIELIRAVMFHPTSNRLSTFLEISALSIALSQSGGAQYKAGYLYIEAETGKGGGFGRKGLNWREKQEARWCAVRESYLVVLAEPGETEVWDVFMLDSDFKIERPKRYLRQGLNLLQGLEPEKVHKAHHHHHAPDGGLLLPEPIRPDNASHTRSHATFSTIRSRLSRIVHSFGRRRREDDRDSDASSSSSSSVGSRPPTPMLDPSTNANPLVGIDGQPNQEQDGKPKASTKKEKDVSKHTFYIENSQMRLKLFAKSERQMLQWITALERIAATSHFTGSNRFDSFAPIRLNVATQWLVDGRDYFWNLSRAILLAKETIYIHDWWLSPELYLRRPNMEKYRLDRLLERKAKEGVKIHIILYLEVSNRTTPTDSNYAKQRLMSLHPNIMVQRSPSHFQTGTFYWAHHEKLCVIDQTIAFMGGVDACFGRWDTPQHVLVDDPEITGVGAEVWPGKDYSNPRVLDFHTLSRPDEDMYDRAKVPRMPWHDVGMQVVGQPARDLARHFVERWNYLLRIKKHSRVMPFLLPPPEFRPGELIRMGLTGTCEMQICRSAGPWSLGTPNRIEHSIQNAYLKAIQLSEHFVYIENQFFITSTVVNDTKIENRIGDAIVHRIIRAHREGTPWKCCIVIPLLPGFTFPVDHSDASAIRIILECQNRTIARGPNSIFSRLRKEGIDPDEYISVFSLRNWAKMRGDVLTTEQVYIHAKVCIVDDRLAIIGSANINERSQRGDRDSEIAAIIRDTDLIECTMAGKPFKVGRFAHSLRIRLMREHLGIDVDGLDSEDNMPSEPRQATPTQDQPAWDPDAEQRVGQPGVTRVGKHGAPGPTMHMAEVAGDMASQVVRGANDVAENEAGKFVQKLGVEGTQAGQTGGEKELEEERKDYNSRGEKKPGFASAVVPTLEEKMVSERLPPKDQVIGTPLEEKMPPNGNAQHLAEQTDPSHSVSSPESEGRTPDGELYGAPADASRSPYLDDQPPHARSSNSDADEEDNTATEARATLRKHLGSKLGGSKWTLPIPRPKFGAEDFEDPISDRFWKNIWVASAVHNTEIFRKVFHAIPDDMVTTWKQYREFIVHHERMNKPPRDSTNPEPVGRAPSESFDEEARSQNLEANGDDAPRPSTQDPDGSPEKRRPAKSGVEPFDKWERDEMENLLGQLCGHLVIYPNRFLEGEDVANNFLFNADRMLPLPIYD